MDRDERDREGSGIRLQPALDAERRERSGVISIHDAITRRVVPKDDATVRSGRSPADPTVELRMPRMQKARGPRSPLDDVPRD